MINLELTPKVKAWLDTEPQKRSLEKGAELLLRITRNRILYNNIMRRLEARADVIEYHLKKIYSQRLVDTTHAEVRQMMRNVEQIAESRGLNHAPSAQERSEFQRGKRADHDELPAEIQQLYIDNADIMRRMRDAHTKLRLISPETSTCPDSDRYPIAKYLIEQDRIYRDNWNRYDHYIRGTAPDEAVSATDNRTESKNAQKLCFLLLGHFAKSPSDQLADRIREAFAKVVAPSDSLIRKMEDAGLK